MSTVFAIDPGTTDSAYVLWDGAKILRAEIVPNDQLLNEVCRKTWPGMILALEMVACYGMSVGREVFETCLWIGRFVEAWDSRNTLPAARLIYRREIKMHHCGNMHAKDANVAQALRDKYGEKGTKANPGVTYQLKSHLWQAFALATYVTETQPPTHENTESHNHLPGR